MLNEVQEMALLSQVDRDAIAHELRRLANRIERTADTRIGYSYHAKRPLRPLGDGKFVHDGPQTYDVAVSFDMSGKPANER